MAKIRATRSAPTRKMDPLDEYSTWDVRVARTFYYATIVASVVIFLGIWITIIGQAIKTGGLQAFFENFQPALIAAIISGIVTLHLLLLVIFYTLFRGGIYKLCKILFPDRKIAKKYEDFDTLRFLIAILLLAAYVTITFVIIFLIPAESWAWMWGVMLDIANQLTLGTWIIWFGLVMLLTIAFFLFAFILWSHGVFAVLKRIKKIEEEIEIDEELKDEKLKGLSEEELHKEYHKQTGKNAIYRGKETKSYKSWKKSKVG